MEVLQSKPNYIFMNLILSKTKPFTIFELIEELNTNGVSVSEESEVLPVLNRFKENGLVIQRGSKYTLSDLVFG